MIVSDVIVPRRSTMTPEPTDCVCEVLGRAPLRKNWYMRGAQEIDILELFWGSTTNCHAFLGSNLGSSIQTNLFKRNVGGWSTTGLPPFTYNNNGSLGGHHSYQFIFSDGHTYRYVDDVLIQADVYEWNAQTPVQLGINLAAGSVSAAYAANTMFPMAATNFPSQSLGIESVKIWYSSP